MTIWNLGSINIDTVYAVPHLPQAGETLAASRMRRFLGGKGANMSVAAARAGASVRHIGAIGAEGSWTRDRLQGYGVGTDFVDTVDGATGHAIVAVDRDGENQIILYPGANRAISMSRVEQALSQAQRGDWLLFQNETNAQRDAAALARDKGLRVAYAAAPFDAAAVSDVLAFLDFLILNAVEAEQLQQATGQAPGDLPVPHVIVTKGAQGAEYFDTEKGISTGFDAVHVDPVDTTGAGDTFTGYVLAGLDGGMSMTDAITRAMRAAALMVMRHGTADVIPTAE